LLAVASRGTDACTQRATFFARGASKLQKSHE
jgi:hypothetical protein